MPEKDINQIGYKSNMQCACLVVDNNSEAFEMSIIPLWFSWKVHEKYDNKIAWDRAMDEVRAERWEKRYKERTLEVMIKYWPDTDKYKNRPELVTSLENQVCCSLFLLLLATWHL